MNDFNNDQNWVKAPADHPAILEGDYAVARMRRQGVVVEIGVNNPEFIRITCGQFRAVVANVNDAQSILLMLVYG